MNSLIVWRIQKPPKSSYRRDSALGVMIVTALLALAALYVWDLYEEQAIGTVAKALAALFGAISVVSAGTLFSAEKGKIKSAMQDRGRQHQRALRSIERGQDDS